MIYSDHYRIRHALSCLVHPLALAAVALIFLNDLVLKPLAPSALSGLLSDLGALFLSPLLLAGLVSLLLSRRAAGMIGLGATLALFAALKLSPLSNAWLHGLAQSAGFSFRSLPDPADMLALPGWLAAAWLWFRPSPTPVRAARDWRLLILPAAALVLMGDAAMPDFGAACLSGDAGALRTRAQFRAYQSLDGGLSWQTVDYAGPDSCPQQAPGASVEIETPAGVHYRAVIQRSLERSSDGQTWQTLITAAELSEPERAYLRKTMPANLYYQPGPLDMRLDPASGNVVVAMGLAGVKVYTPAGDVRDVQLGANRYQRLDQAGPGGYLTLLGSELWLALGIGLAWLSTALARYRRSGWMKAWVIIAWLCLGLACLVLDPGLANDGYLGPFVLMGLAAVLLLVFALAVTALVRARTQPARLLVTRAALALPVGLAVWTPYLLWAFGFLPHYWAAQLGVAALAGVLILITTQTGPRPVESA